MAINCYANPNPIFQPSMRIVSAITQSNPAQVTTTFAHQYNTGLIVRLDVPRVCGMQQINSQIGTITVTSPTSFTIGIDSTYYDPFIYPPATQGCPLVVPVGEVNADLNSAVQNVLP